MNDTPFPPEVGTHLGRFELLRLIGRGGMGVVFLANDTLLDAKIALKVLDPALAMGEGLVRFRREALLARQIVHPGICRIYDMHEEVGQFFIAMEYVEGPTLDEILKQGGKLPPWEAVEVVSAVCRAVEAAHATDIVHRDLKPGNVIVRGNADRISVLDFGLSRASSMSNITEAGVAVGTLSYMSPEVLRGEPATKQSDVYSTGVLLYECVTGRLPFVADTIFDMQSAIVEGRITPPRQVIADLPLPLESIITSAMANDPSERFTSMWALERALSNISEDVLIDPAGTLPLATRVVQTDRQTSPAPDLDPSERTEAYASLPQSPADGPTPNGDQAGTDGPTADGCEVGTDEPPTEDSELDVFATRGEGRPGSSPLDFRPPFPVAEAASSGDDGEDLETNTSGVFASRSETDADSETDLKTAPIDMSHTFVVPRGPEGTLVSPMPRRKPLLTPGRALALAVVTVGGLGVLAMFFWWDGASPSAPLSDSAHPGDAEVQEIEVATGPAVQPVDIPHPSADAVVDEPHPPAPIPASATTIAASAVPDGEKTPAAATPNSVAAQEHAAQEHAAQEHAAQEHAAQEIGVAGEARRPDKEPLRRAPPRASNPKASRSRSPATLTAIKKQLQALRRKKGIVPGDSPTLDRELRRMAALERDGDQREAAAVGEAALAFLGKLAIDEAFVERKLLRFNERFDRVDDETKAQQVSELSRRSLEAMGAGNYLAANRLLNKALAQLGSP